jgi:large subunit ribosomal protein L18
MKKINYQRRLRRKYRISSNLFGTNDRPRISIYRSSKFIYAQAIDDAARVTLASFSSLQLKKTSQKSKKTESAGKVGQELAKTLIKKGITTGIFDRGAYNYLGRVKALAEGMREVKFII